MLYKQTQRQGRRGGGRRRWRKNRFAALGLGGIFFSRVISDREGDRFLSELIRKAPEQIFRSQSRPERAGSGRIPPWYWWDRSKAGAAAAGSRGNTVWTGPREEGSPIMWVCSLGQVRWLEGGWGSPRRTGFLAPASREHLGDQRQLFWSSAPGAQVEICQH